MVKKEEVLEKIKAGVAKNSQLSDRTINETLENLMPFVTAETKLEDFVKTVEHIFETMAGNIRKDVSDSVKKFIEERKPEPKTDAKDEKKANPKEAPKEEPKEVDDATEMLRSILEEINSIKERQAQQEKAKSASEIKQLALEKVKIYPKNVIEAALFDFDFTRDDAEQKFIDKVGKTANLFGVKPEKGASKPKAPDFSALRKKLDEEAEFNN